MDFPGPVEIKQEVISIDDDDLERENVLQFFEYDDPQGSNYPTTSWSEQMSRDEVKNEIMLDCLIAQEDDIPIKVLQFNEHHHHRDVGHSTKTRILEEPKEELIIPDITDNLHHQDNLSDGPSTIKSKSRVRKLSHLHRTRGRRGKINSSSKCDHVKKINYLTEKVLKLEIKYLKARIKALNDRVKCRDDEIARLKLTENRCVSCRAITQEQQQQQKSSPQQESVEKVKIIQQQISLLLHALQCQRGLENNDQCTVMVHCRSAKLVLEHIKTCQLGRNCGIKHCFSSRQILGHFKHCQVLDCTVCLPFRQCNIRLSPSLYVNIASPTTLNTSHLSSQLPFLTTTTTNYNNAESPGTSNVQNSNLQYSGSPSSSSSSSSHQYIVPDEGDFGTFNDGSTVTATTQGLGENSSSSSSFSPQNFVKSWQQSMNGNIRRQIIHRFVKAIFPVPPGLSVSLDRRVCNLVDYCRKVEGRMYEAANSSVEYLSLMSEEICKAKNEIDRKRQERKMQQQQQQEQQE